MEELDNRETNDPYDEEEEMFLKEVIQDEHDLLFLDSYLRETLGTGNTI